MILGLKPAIAKRSNMTVALNCLEPLLVPGQKIRVSDAQGNETCLTVTNFNRAAEHPRPSRGWAKHLRDQKAKSRQGGNW